MVYVIDEKLLQKDISETSSLDAAIQLSDDIVEIYFQHFGVKGMRWGVRKKDDATGRDGSTPALPRREQRARLLDAKAAKLDVTIKELNAEIQTMPLTGPYRPDPLEGRFDPFFSVNPETGHFRDFSPSDYPEPQIVVGALMAALKEPNDNA